MGDLQMYRGDSLTVTETVGPVGLGANGIQGWQFRMTAKWDADDPDSAAVFQKVPSAWQITTQGVGPTGSPPVGGTAGVVFCNLLPSDTASLPAYQVALQFDVQATDASGHVFTIDAGTLTVFADVTITEP